jgi:site-specific DNA-methyltransferase (adenine-specific)
VITNIIHGRPCGQLVELPNESIHVAVTSPPFNLSYRPQRSKKFNIGGYGDTCPDCLPEPEYQDRQIAVLNALGRVLAPGGSVYYNHKDRIKDGRIISPHQWLDRVEELVLYQTIVIDRGSSHNVDPVRLPPATEYIYWMCKPGHKPRFNKSCPRWGLVWRLDPRSETRRNPHPAPFARAVPLRCIIMSAPGAGEIVLDPFMGSGSTAVAATILGLPYVGYEVNPDYIALAEHRVAEARKLWNGGQDRPTAA